MTFRAAGINGGHCVALPTSIDPSSPEPSPPTPSQLHPPQAKLSRHHLVRLVCRITANPSPNTHTHPTAKRYRKHPLGHQTPIRGGAPADKHFGQAPDRLSCTPHARRRQLIRAARRMSAWVHEHIEGSRQHDRQSPCSRHPLTPFSAGSLKYYIDVAPGRHQLVTLPIKKTDLLHLSSSARSWCCSGGPDRVSTNIHGHGHQQHSLAPSPLPLLAHLVQRGIA